MFRVDRGDEDLLKRRGQRTLISHLRIGAVKLVSSAFQRQKTNAKYLAQTLLAAMARAFALTRPSTCRTTTAASERYHVTPGELATVQPIPEKNGKGKGKAKVKEEPDGARQLVEAKLVEATALLRKV